jgi:ribulose-5-phosphate 4-epimerase/fuculose-1-phosphate aldolase
VLGRLAYHDYEGIALDNGEQERLVRDIGDKDVLILRNHGLLTMGRSVAEAFQLMFYLERACRIQVSALAGGRPVIYPPAAVRQRTTNQFADDSSFVEGRDWQALLRLLDRLDPSYKE